MTPLLAASVALDVTPRDDEEAAMAGISGSGREGEIDKADDPTLAPSHLRHSGK